MKKVPVRLGERSYHIEVGQGILSHLHEILTPLSLGKKGVLLTDSHVRSPLAESLVAQLNKKEWDVSLVEIPAGENSKSIEIALSLWEKCLDLKLDRNSFILTLGGGVVGDLGGFVAATYLRGIPFVQIPTTLLAQVDSSVGGKVGVNLPQGKNLIGSFYQPRAVVIDTDVLKTLPQREFLSGLGEVIKYGIIWDHSFFRFLDKQIDQLKQLDPEPLTTAIAKSCEIKALVVEMDEKELGMRAVLNYGHTFGHAYEAAKNYKDLRHGEAIAVGMIAAAKLSHKMNLCSSLVVSEIESLIQKAGLPTKVRGLSLDKVRHHMQVDKKAQAGKLKFILVQEIGKVVTRSDVPDALLNEVILESLDA